MDGWTIGKVAREGGVGVETIRFYEREGLIERPPRRGGAYRRYPVDAVARLRFIRRAKRLGFSLREIRELLDLRMDPDTTCEAVRRRAQAKIDDIDQRIRSLRQMKRSLTRLSRACGGGGRVSECPILDALDARSTR